VISEESELEKINDPKIIKIRLGKIRVLYFSFWNTANRNIEPKSGNNSEFEDFVDKNHNIPRPKINIGLFQNSLSPRKNVIDAANKNIVEDNANDSLKSEESCSTTTELDASTKYKIVKTNRKCVFLINFIIEIHKYSHASEPTMD
jgi:hypothetical protein